MAVAQLIVSALGLLWFIFGSSTVSTNSNYNNQHSQQPTRQVDNKWVYRGTDNQYHYYSDYSGYYWSRINVLTGEVSYKR